MATFTLIRNLILLACFGSLTFLLSSGCEETIIKPYLPVEPDTTTHDWYFEVDTLGENLSGARGIVAFAKDDAWATGEFRIYKDPNDPTKGWDIYNIARWDGKVWKLGNIGSGVGSGATELYARDKNFMIAVEDYFYFWNGVSWHTVKFTPGTFKGIYGIWAESPTIVHLIGGEGTWTIWNGSVESPSFRKNPTRTTIDLTDIYGDGDKIYACGTDVTNNRSVLLLYENGKFTGIDSTNSTQVRSHRGVWYSSTENFLALADVKVTVERNGVEQHAMDSFPNIPRMMTVRASDTRNIWWAGHFLDLVHYNGKSFHHFSYPFPQSGIFKRISVQEDYFFAAGFQRLQNGEYRGLVVRGYRR